MESMLVSGGENIKFWSTKSFECMQQIKPHTGDISSVDWSNDNSCLASTSNAGDKIVLTYPSMKYRSMVLDCKETKSKTCLAFDSQSKHLVAGGPEGIIHIWNLKNHRLKSTFWELKGPTTCLQFSKNDSIVAASSETSGLIIFNLTSLKHTFLTFSDQQIVASIHALKFNYCRETLLATVSDDGSTILWDTEALQPLHKFQKGHIAPAMDLAFSPVNKMFLVSVGLDKNIICHDVFEKKILMIFPTPNLLTSVDIMDDGVTMAIGTSNGLIQKYDLRSLTEPLATTLAHKTSVHQLKFQRNIKKNILENNSSLNAYASLQQKISDNDNSYRSNVTSRKEKLARSPKDKTNALTTSQIEARELIEKMPDNTDFLNTEPLRSSSRHNIFNSSSEMRNALFSLNQQVSHLATEQPLVNGNVETIDNLHQKTNTLTDGHSQKMANSFSFDISQTKTNDSNIEHSVTMPSLREKLTENLNKKSNDQILYEKDKLVTASNNSNAPLLLSNISKDNNVEDKLIQSNKEPAQVDVLQQAQKDFIREVIRDEMDSYFEQIHRDVLGLHVDVLSRFQSLQEDLLISIRQSSTNNELIQEIKRLKLENETLRKQF